MTPKKVQITQVRLIEPSLKIDGLYNVTLENGVISEISAPLQLELPVNLGANSPEFLDTATDQVTVIDGLGKVLLPGLFDMHVHLREPGYEHKETIASGTLAAARGGVTGVLAMPNTYPTVESGEIVKDIQNRIKQTAVIDVKLTGSITKGLQGRELSDLSDMFEAGIVAITDDGRTTMSEVFMAEAMDFIKGPDSVLISHAEDHDMVKGGAIHQGDVSESLGLKGIPAEAEYKIVARDIALAKQTGARLHIAHISTKEAVQFVREAQAQGLPITAEAGPHHFMQTDELVKTQGTLAKVNPPLRSEDHRAAVEAGLLDGTITIIATDHAPHTLEEKSADMYAAPFGISGVELSLAFTYTHFVKTGKFDWLTLAHKMAVAPRVLLHQAVPRLEVGAVANMVLFDPQVDRVICNADLVSKGKNTPFEGMTVSGDVLATWYQGKVVYSQLAL